MVVIYLDAQNKLTGIYPIIGTVNQCVVFPREIIKHALLCSASSFIMVHNHPSGNINPSTYDIALTKKIQNIARELDIELHDHAIIGGNNFYSFREEGII
jgi:DNA repair protein RadC